MNVLYDQTSFSLFFILLRNFLLITRKLRNSIKNSENEVGS